MKFKFGFRLLWSETKLKLPLSTKEYIMRITQKVLDDTLEEVNLQLHKHCKSYRLRLRVMSCGEGKLVKVVDLSNKTKRELTDIGESNREVYSYLIGVIHGLDSPL